MGENTKIEWTTHTFNPWRGCTKVSDGCTNCYAETMSGRNPGNLGVWGKNGTRVIASESMWKQPLKWNAEAARLGERHRVFCSSLADVFEGPDTMPVKNWEAVTKARFRLFDEIIPSTPHLDWLLLTKRPESVPSTLLGLGLHETVEEYLPPNVWIGTSVEDQKTADERIPELLKIPAKVRFLSMEPLLGDMNLLKYLDMELPCFCGHISCNHEAIDWVIVGGESGPNARPMHPDWVRSIRDQCQAAGVPFFFKQWGEWVALAGQEPGEDFARVHGHSKRKDFCFPINSPNCEQAATMYKVGKQKAGRILDGREWNEFPKSKPVS